MLIFILGLIIFLGTHSIRIFFEAWRIKQIHALGEKKWKGIYSLLSLIGFVLIIIGYNQTKLSNIVIWNAPLWTWHITILLNLIASILITASYVPNNAIKVKLYDPMILGVKTWAFAHLISNGTLVGIILFGSFLIWAIVDYKSCRTRRLSITTESIYLSSVMTAVTLVIGIIVWAVILFYGHELIIGINPIM